MCCHGHTHMCTCLLPKELDAIMIGMSMCLHLLPRTAVLLPRLRSCCISVVITMATSQQQNSHQLMVGTSLCEGTTSEGPTVVCSQGRHQTRQLIRERKRMEVGGGLYVELHGVDLTSAIFQRRSRSQIRTCR